VADQLTKEQRSANMRQIKSSGTKPELAVRKIIHGLGYRYRLHANELPGKPDIVRRPQKQAIFVHGCFWHQHPLVDCLDGRSPKSNQSYWSPKLAGNVARDQRNVTALRRSGWRIMVVWDCELKKPEKLRRRLVRFLAG
jgi:DNA mismatch endonuclease (patch repair protein)